jgi:hypothetical protein
MNDELFNETVFRLSCPVWAILNTESLGIVTLQTEQGNVLPLFTDQDLVVTFIEQAFPDSNRVPLEYNDPQYLLDKLLNLQKDECNIVVLDPPANSPLINRLYAISTVIQSLQQM